MLGERNSFGTRFDCVLLRVVWRERQAAGCANSLIAGVFFNRLKCAATLRCPSVQRGRQSFFSLLLFCFFYTSLPQTNDRYTRLTNCLLPLHILSALIGSFCLKRNALFFLSSFSFPPCQHKKTHQYVVNQRCKAAFSAPARVAGSRQDWHDRERCEAASPSAATVCAGVAGDYLRRRRGTSPAPCLQVRTLGHDKAAHQRRRKGRIRRC